MNTDYLTDEAMSRVAGGLLLPTGRSITAVFYCAFKGLDTKEVVPGEGLVPLDVPVACPEDRR